MATGYEKVIEDIPDLYTRRQGDWTAEGANNAIIVLGTDRSKKDGPATGTDGLGNGKGAGTAAVIVGRRNKKGHPDINSDDASLYLSMKTKVDENLHCDALVMGKNSKAPNSPAGPAAILKSKDIRIAFGKDGMVKIFLSGANDRYLLLSGDTCEIHIGQSFVNVKDDEVTIEGASKIRLGAEAAEQHVILGDAFIEEFLRHTHQSPVGPTSPPVIATVPKTVMGVGGVLSKKSLVE